jgi:hypothetical protein
MHSPLIPQKPPGAKEICKIAGTTSPIKNIRYEKLPAAKISCPITFPVRNVIAKTTVTRWRMLKSI